jgi:hypothetical protein
MAVSMEDGTGRCDISLRTDVTQFIFYSYRDVPLPRNLEQDDQETSTWMATFHDLIDISKIMGRIAKFNYSPHASERGPIRVNHHIV